jgi:hypothetical protein
MMKLHRFSYGLIVVTTLVFVSLVWLGWPLRRESQRPILKTSLVVQARQPSNQEDSTGPSLPSQVMMGTPEQYEQPTEPSRYTYRNEFPEDRSKVLPLYVIDTQTGQETRLGDDSDAAFFSVMDDQNLIWHFAGFRRYNLRTGQNTLISEIGNPGIHPQLSGDWLAFGRYNGGGSKVATLYAANLATQEVITLTQTLPARDASVSGYFGISDHLAAWYEARNTIVIYDLAARSEITRLTDINVVFNEQYLDVYDLSPGETVVTWSRNYGYDLVTRSYFRIERVKPPDWDNQPIANMRRIQERDRILSWTFELEDGTQRHIRAPLLDATPSATPCVEGQNLVQNGDLEDMAQHDLWSQSGNQSNLLVDDPPPGAPAGGAWAIRLGRYRNATHEMRQLLDVPSGVKALTLHFDVQVGTWDRWGGDWLEVDLVDPASGQSYLVTPVRWRNTQLLSSGWLPVEVQIEGWPAVDAPVYLAFRGLTDWAIPTDFTLDNIRLVTACQ